MSSARAASDRLGGAKDAYPTPAWCVHRLLEAWTPRPGVWVEPAAGSGALVRAVNECVRPAYEPEWLALEIDPTYRMDLRDSIGRGWSNICDFLSAGATANVYPRAVTAVITNPPYTSAQLFIERCRLLYPYAEVVMLLRVGFLESEGRRGFWPQVGLPDLYVLPNRPSFLGNGTDSAIYAWFVWPPAEEAPRDRGEFRLLGYTSLEDRKKWR